MNPEAGIWFLLAALLSTFVSFPDVNLQTRLYGYLLATILMLIGMAVDQ